MHTHADHPADAESLRALLSADLLDARAYREAVVVYTTPPSRQTWLRVLDLLLLSLGAGLIAAGIIYFFAFNWAALHKFAKLGGLAVVISASAGFTIYRGLDALSGRIALTVAATLTGVLLAVYGQIYQTGADPWQLFAGWAALIGPWALLGGFAPLWIIWLIIANLGWGLYIGQISYAWISAPAFLGHTLLLSAAWLVAAWRGPRWSARTIATAAMLSSVISAIILIYSRSHLISLLGSLAHLALLMGLIAHALRSAPQDLFNLALAGAGLLLSSTALWARFIFEGFNIRELGVLALGALVLIEVSAMAYGLKTLHRRNVRRGQRP